MSYDKFHEEKLNNIAGSISFDIDEDFLGDEIEKKLKEELPRLSPKELAIDKERVAYLYHQLKKNCLEEDELRYRNLNEYGDDKNNPA